MRTALWSTLELGVTLEFTDPLISQVLKIQVADDWIYGVGLWYSLKQLLTLNLVRIHRHLLFFVSNG